MTVGEMQGYTKRLKEIMQIKNVDQRNQRLANLMTDLEQAYQIPMIGKDRIERFKEKNIFAWQLYRTVSFSREF